MFLTPAMLVVLGLIALYLIFIAPRVDDYNAKEEAKKKAADLESDYDYPQDYFDGDEENGA